MSNRIFVAARPVQPKSGQLHRLPPLPSKRWRSTSMAKKPTVRSLLDQYRRLWEKQKVAFQIALATDPTSIIHQDYIRLFEEVARLRYGVEIFEQQANALARKVEHIVKKCSRAVTIREEKAYFLHCVKGESLRKTAHQLSTQNFTPTTSDVNKMINRYCRRTGLVRPLQKPQT
jgi:hypothetical protein